MFELCKLSVFVWEHFCPLPTPVVLPVEVMSDESDTVLFTQQLASTTGTRQLPSGFKVDFAQLMLNDLIAIPNTSTRQGNVSMKSEICVSYMQTNRNISSLQ